MANVMTDLGTITITEEVLAIIAGYSAEQCYGIVGMINKNAADGLAHLLNIENHRRGVRITTLEDGTIIIDLLVMIKYGVSISAVAGNAISTIKYSVETSTGIRVHAINITVAGIQM